MALASDPGERRYSWTDNPYSASVFTTGPDGEITVDQWYPMQTIAHELLGLSRNIQTTIRITCANGTAEYRVIGLDRSGQNLVCELIDGAVSVRDDRGIVAEV
jgi:hypothetical protein